MQAQHQPRSYIQIFKSTLEAMTKDRWINTAKILAFVVASGGLAVAATYYGVNFLTQRYDQMSRGLLGIYPKEASPFEIRYMNPIRLYNKWDFFGDCFMTGGGLFAISVISIAWFSKLPKDSIFSVYTTEKQPYRVVQELKKLPSSMNDFDLQKLANNKEGQIWLDPITMTEIPEAEIRSPRILRIQNHAFGIETLLIRIFSKPLQDNKIWHPYFNGYMNAQDQQKFVYDISTFFCISEAQLLDCWKLDITVDKVPGNITLNNLFVLARMIKFLELIPNETTRNNLASILLQEQRALVVELSRYPMSLTYIEIFGHYRFSVQRFLNT